MAGKLDFRDYIVGTKQNITFLHRCFKEDVDGILREGLSCWSEDLSGTATMQPRDLRDAEGLYRIGRDHGDAAVVIQFPREKYSQNARRGSNLTNRALSYFHPRRGEFTVRPEFVVAWIDRDTDEVHLNPYPDRKPAAGHEKFDFIFD